MADKGPSVVLRNTMRRPVTFHVAGTTVRLAPGERMEMPAKWVAGPDMQRFTGAGLIVNETSLREQVARAEEREREIAEEVVEERDDQRAETEEEKEPRPGEIDARTGDEQDDGDDADESSLFRRLTGKKSVPKSSKTGKHKPSKPEK